MNNTTIDQIAKKTIQKIKSNNESLNPRTYQKEFCQTASELNFTAYECEYLKKSIVSFQENHIIDRSINIETTYDLIDLIIQKIHKKSLTKLSNLLQNTIQPSISLKLDEKLEAFCVKIGDSPALIFEESIQKEIQSFIEKRFEVDRSIVAQKTADIARLITLMSRYLNDAIHTGKTGKDQISKIHKNIQNLKNNESSKEDLKKLHTKLESAAKNIQSELDTVNKNFLSNQDEVMKLEKRVKELEKELHETKKENDSDFLTKVLNRKGFDKEIDIYEENFVEQKRDYAVIFFDIDFFKKINDGYGHDCGDAVLKTFASIIKKLTSSEHRVARFGGEEFVVIFSYYEYNMLKEYLQKIKRVITMNLFVYKKEKFHVTFSAGVQLRSNCSNSNQTLLDADALLYKAKHNGRDKINLWDENFI